ncbi:flagellar hook-associated protein 3 [Ramlibacter sp. RBP-2]|uniref:Flagellar hook-associated protein 3 n=1 Tax=Ramlibacter lithotrophicus TaxID=2606681 RepID=A0A7X6DFE0_9BURK|nr:flagellar hook-associated protein FlgL [Ramlibacter lithotrophicus]NKE66165.1 flagellar hook-associated protein 3 [Ramlibacter lithotrophicus]
MRISTQAFFERNAAGMGRLQQKLFQVQQKIGAGSKFITPSQDPVAAARALGVSQSLAETSQYAASRSRAGQSLAMEETALQSATRVLQEVKALIVQAGNGTLTDADRATLGTALESQFAELLGVANSTDGNGQYLFAGFKGDAPPFVAQGATVAYNGDQGQRLVQVDVSRQMAVTDDGESVFRAVQGSAVRVPAAGAGNQGSGVFGGVNVTDGGNYELTFDTTATATAKATYTLRNADDGTVLASGDFTAGEPITAAGLSVRIDGAPVAGDVFTVGNAQQAGTDVFQAMRDLITALRVPATDAASLADVRNALGTANAKITNAHDNVLTVRSAVGSRLAELDSLDASGEWRNIVDQTYLSELQDLDYASALTEFAQRESNLRATQQTFARLQSIALFNYL